MSVCKQTLSACNVTNNNHYTYVDIVKKKIYLKALFTVAVIIILYL